MSDKDTVILSVEGMTCASCVRRVEGALATVPGVLDAAVNLANETARVSFATPADLTGLIDTLNEAGYPATTGEVTLEVESMTCASCVGRVERKLKASNGVIDAQVNLATDEPPQLNWSAPMFRKRRTKNGKQATEARRDRLEITAG